MFTDPKSCGFNRRLTLLLMLANADFLRETIFIN